MKILSPFNPVDGDRHGDANLFMSAFRYQEKRSALLAWPWG